MSGTNGKVCSYFPGCSSMATGKDAEAATQAVVRTLGVQFVELDDWNCCGATMYVAIDKKKSMVLSARNLAIAEKSGRDLVSGCSGCYLALRKTNKYLNADPKLFGQVRKALQAGGMDYKGSVNVRHVLDVIVRDVGEQEIKKAVKKPLKGLKVACYAGCQIGRPYGDVDDPEFPKLMERLVTWLGGTPVQFPYTAKCCGGMLMTTQPQLGRTLTGKILKNAKFQGADVLATACPLCQINLEGFQGKASDAVGVDCDLPVVYFTQLMARSFGLRDEDVALACNMTGALEVIHQKVP